MCEHHLAAYVPPEIPLPYVQLRPAKPFSSSTKIRGIWTRCGESLAWEIGQSPPFGPGCRQLFALLLCSVSPSNCHHGCACTSHRRRWRPGTPCGLGVLMGPDVWVTRAADHLQPHSVVVVGRRAAKAALCGRVPGTTTRPAPDVWVEGLRSQGGRGLCWGPGGAGGQEAGRGSPCPTTLPLGHAPEPCCQSPEHQGTGLKSRIL